MSKKFVSTLTSYMETREVLKMKLRELSNLKTQTTFSDLSSVDNVRRSVSISRLQAKICEDVASATSKFQDLQNELVMKTHELAVALSALEDEAEAAGEGHSGVDVTCARTICHGTQQQALLELCLAEKLCADGVDSDLLVTIAQCFSQEVYMDSSRISDVLSVK